MEYDLTEVFHYHPPTSDARIQAHDEVNRACTVLAKELFDECHNPNLRKELLLLIQGIRMNLNAQIVYNDFNINLNDHIKNGLNLDNKEEYEHELAIHRTISKFIYQVIIYLNPNDTAMFYSMLKKLINLYDEVSFGLD